MQKQKLNPNFVTQKQRHTMLHVLKHYSFHNYIISSEIINQNREFDSSYHSNKQKKLDGRIPYTGVLVIFQTWGVFVIRPIYRGHRHLPNKQTNKQKRTFYKAEYRISMLHE